MPLVWNRDEYEEEAYSQSLLAGPGRRFVVFENSQKIIFYEAGKKCEAQKIIKTEKHKQKFRYNYFQEIMLSEWHKEKQISFGFMHPLSRHHLEVKSFVPDISFSDKQLSLIFE